MRLWRVESYAQDVVTKLSRWLLSKERRKTFDFENHMAWLSSLFFYSQWQEYQEREKIGFVSGYLIGSLWVPKTVE